MHRIPTYALIHHFRGNHMTTEKPQDARTRQIDLDEVARLIEAMERDLQKIPGSSADVRRLRDEIQTLKNVLNSPVRRHHWVSDALHDIREHIEDKLDTAVTEGMAVGRHIAEIGRILGM